MENITRLICAILSFVLPLVGVGLYLTYNKKNDAKLFGMISVIGIFVYIAVGIGFI